MNQTALLQLHKDHSDFGREMMAKKNSDYTPNPDEDALDQFKLIAKIVGITPAQVVLVFQATKLIRMGSVLQHGVNMVATETVMDTNLDALNYSVLMAAVLQDGVAAQAGKPSPSYEGGLEQRSKLVQQAMAVQRESDSLAAVLGTGKVVGPVNNMTPLFPLSEGEAKALNLAIGLKGDTV